MNIKKRFTALVFTLLVMCQHLNAQCNLGSLTAMTGTFSACPGNSFSYTVAAVTNATSYTWNLPAGASINSQNPYTSAALTVTVDYDLSFSPPGNICVYANNSNCTVGPLCKQIIAQPVTSGASGITGAIAACPGDVLNYSVASVPNKTYNWTAPAGATISSGQGTNQVTVSYASGFTAQGNLCVTVSNGCVSSAPRCMTINLNTPPSPPPITGPTTVCGGSSGNYSVATNPRTTNYIWTVPAGASIVGQGTENVTVTFPSGFIYGSVNVQYSNACFTSQSSGVNVRSRPATPASMTGITAGLCGGSTNYSTPLINGATSYNWTTTNPATIIAGQSTNNATINFPANYNTGKVCVYPVNSCGTGTPRCLNLKKEIELTVQPTNAVVCYETSASFAADAQGLNLLYQWRKNGVPLNDGGTISGSQSQTLNISPADSADFGAYSVAVSNSCAPQKVSSAAQLVFNYVPVLPAAIVGGNPVTCPGTTGVTYSVPSQPDISTYSWTTSLGATIMAGYGTNNITIDFGPTINSGYYIILKVANQCGSGSDSVSTWTRYSISTPAIITGPDKICPGQSGIVYSTQTIGGADNYTWTPPPGAAIASGQGTNSIEMNFGAGYTGGNLLVTANNMCYTTPQKQFAIGLDIPSQPVSISGQSYSACNTTLSYSTPAVNGASSYNWILPSGATIVNGAATSNVGIQFTNPGNQAKLCVTANSACFASPLRCIAIKARPAALSLITSNPGVVCANQSGVIYSVATPPLASTSVNWFMPDGTVIVSGQTTPSVTVNMGSANGNITATPVNSCSGGSTRVLAVNFSCRNASDDVADNVVNDVKNIFEVYPNPAHSHAVVKFNSAGSNSYSIELFDMLGKTVYKEGGISSEGINEHKLSLKGFTPGIYLLSLKGENVNGHFKLQVK